MSKLMFCFSWFVLALVTYTTAASLLYTIRQTHEIAIIPSHVPVTTSSTIPSQSETQGISQVIETGDARPFIISSFLERHNSPLTPHDHFGQYIVEMADKYDVDYRLIPAIMMQESNLCKNAPEGAFNCLGFGIHKRGTLEFESYEASIERATRELKANYIDIGLTTPEKIMKKYTPSSNGSWAESVNQWIAEMEYNDRVKGKTEKTDADLTVYPQ